MVSERPATVNSLPAGVTSATAVGDRPADGAGNIVLFGLMPAECVFVVAYPRPVAVLA